MRSFLAFLNKEWMEQVRSGRLLILGILFSAFGIMNPAIAKLTPWLLETLSESLAESGMVITDVSVDAMDSWVQFFKNIPMALIAFVLMYSGVFTKEYDSGSLVLVLTKGLARWKVLFSKSIVMFTVWSAGYFLCFGITYAYNEYFWDNSVASSLISAVMYWWGFGIWVICLVLLFSTLSKSSGTVMVSVLFAVVLPYLLSMIPKLKYFMPTTLMDTGKLIAGAITADEFAKTVAVTIITGILFMGASVVFMKKRKI